MVSKQNRVFLIIDLNFKHKCNKNVMKTFDICENKKGSEPPPYYIYQTKSNQF